MFQSLAIILMILSISGCSAIKAVWAMTQSTEHFIVLKENPAIAYERGVEALALELSGHLQDAVHTVESKQYGTFPDGVKIYVTGSMEHFASYCTSRAPSACVIGNRLFISPKLNDNRERIPKILAHELSHLQLSQSLGRWNYQRNVPSWFAEGLATYVSGGGGAEKAGKDKARQAIRAGKAMVPNGSGSLFSPKRAHSFGLEPHMFYRQSALYVEWLHDSNTAHFQQLLARLHHGSTVEEAMMESYGFTVHEGWKRFADEL